MTNSGETDLIHLITSMSPIKHEQEYIFCSFKNACYGDYSHLKPLASFIENEGLTLVIPKQYADENKIEYSSTFQCITLEVHSSLDAVGLTAAFATQLTEYGISANVIAGFYHDHLFVPTHLADQALKALKALSHRTTR